MTDYTEGLSGTGIHASIVSGRIHLVPSPGNFVELDPQGARQLAATLTEMALKIVEPNTHTWR